MREAIKLRRKAITTTREAIKLTSVARTVLSTRIEFEIVSETPAAAMPSTAVRARPSVSHAATRL
jgi:hypothetical protein